MRAQTKGPGVSSTEPPLTINLSTSSQNNNKFRSGQQIDLRYEQLKARYTANATSRAEFDAGVKRAISESGA